MRAFGLHQVNHRLGGAAAQCADEQLVKAVGLMAKERCRLVADNLFDRQAEKCGKLLIAVEYRAVGPEGGGAFVDGLHQGSVGVFGALKREDLLSLRPGDDNRIHIARLDGVDQLLGFGEACFGIRKPGLQLFNLALCAGFCHGEQHHVDPLETSSLILKGRRFSRAAKSTKKCPRL